MLEKTLIVDLINISDPNGITTAEEGAVGLGEVFGFPFQTIESVYPVDADTLIVVDDNNCSAADVARALRRTTPSSSSSGCPNR
ncbi:MAG: hypothetical protein SGI73_01885 [Chloroflexota bacterium]|nr:hypothetical protein [Chloroflexota bacterium]